MTTCPHCKKPLRLVEGQNAFANADIYDNTNTVKTACCGHAVRIIPVRSYRVEKSYKDEDDWGNRCKVAGRSA